MEIISIQLVSYIIKVNMNFVKHVVKYIDVIY